MMYNIMILNAFVWQYVPFYVFNIKKLVATITIFFGVTDPDLRFVDKAGLNESIINSAM